MVIEVILMSIHTSYPINIKKRTTPETIPNTIMSAAMGFLFLGTQEQVRNSREPLYSSY